VDWDRLENMADYHGVTPLFYASLSKHAPSAVPPHIFARLRERSRANVHHSLLFASELVKLMKRFDAANIRAIPFKGPVLAAYAYHDLTAREFTDLDIFVSKNDIVEATRVVLSQGYVSSLEDPVRAITQAVGRDGQGAFQQAHHYTFYRPDGRSRVDLQWRVADDRYFAQPLERPDLWKSEFTRIPIGGYDIRTFSPTDTLLVLCIHGSKHGWEKLKWLCDVAELLRAHATSIVWGELERVASRLRVERMVRLGLNLVGDLLDASIPPDVARTVASDKRVWTLARELRGSLFDEHRTCPTNHGNVWFYVRLKDHWRDRVRFCFRYFLQFTSSVLTPTAVDRELLPLPRSLFFVHYVFRPIRLSVKYAVLSMRLLRQKVSARV